MLPQAGAVPPKDSAGALSQPPPPHAIKALDPTAATQMQGRGAGAEGVLGLPGALPATSISGSIGGVGAPITIQLQPGLIGQKPPALPGTNLQVQQLLQQERLARLPQLQAMAGGAPMSVGLSLVEQQHLQPQALMVNLPTSVLGAQGVVSGLAAQQAVPPPAAGSEPAVANQ